MQSTATVAADFKRKFFEAIRERFATDQDTKHVLVCFGAPGTYEPEDIVSFGRVTVRQDPATMGNNRAREEVLTLTVTISIARGGGQDQEIVCSDRGYALLRRIELYARKTDTTIGGTVRHCFLQGHESDGETLPELIADGRFIDIDATFEARARITG